MRRILVCTSLLALGGWTAGCYRAARYDYHEAKADYHHEKAESDMDRGHPIGALKEKIKEGSEDAKAH